MPEPERKGLLAEDKPVDSRREHQPRVMRLKRAEQYGVCRGVSRTAFSVTVHGTHRTSSRLAPGSASSSIVWRIANIAHNDAMILPYDANQSRMEFSERTTCKIDGNNRYSCTRNQRSLLVSRTRPRTLRRKMIN